jgi:hypothetical protein
MKDDAQYCTAPRSFGAVPLLGRLVWLLRYRSWEFMRWCGKSIAWSGWVIVWKDELRLVAGNVCSGFAATSAGDLEGAKRALENAHTVLADLLPEHDMEGLALTSRLEVYAGWKAGSHHQGRGIENATIHP